MRNVPNRGPQMRTSRTWTISSGERGLLSDTDEVGNRAAFVQEYNRLAKKVWMGAAFPVGMARLTIYKAWREGLGG